jgi:trigger factor
VQTGDYVSIDLNALVDGEEVEDGSTTGLSYEVGSDSLMNGLDEALVGLAAGASTTFASELVAGGHAGSTAEVTVAVRSVKDKELPALDDEFAQTASEFDTLDELRADLRARLERVAALEQGAQARDRVMEALLAAAEVPLPESAVQAEVDWRMHDITHQLENAGVAMDDYLRSEGRTAEDLQLEIRRNSETAVKTQLVLDAVAEQQQLSVSDAELTEHLVVQAQRYGVSPQEFAQQLAQGGSLPALVSDVRRNKALAHVLEQAAVADTAGQPVDLSALRRRPEADAEDEAGADAARG